ncbi:MAG: protein kinase domain-containing protein, partial [Planctomycetota bacterium]
MSESRKGDTSGFRKYGSNPDADTLPPTPRPQGAGAPITNPAFSPHDAPTLPPSGAAPPSTAAGQPEHKQIGPYVIERELGRGGMGVVYKATQPGLERTVAIKIMLGGEHAGEEAYDRFVREARASGKMRHPNVVAVHDVGLHDGMPFIVMDFVPGRSLAEILHDEDLPARRAVEITRDIAEGLQHAHEHGIIHRDVKPGNILVDAETGRPQLTDFGLARELDAGKGLTQTGAALGTPAYMSPEQAKGTKVDARTDIYGLGAVLYEALAGRPPFEGDNQYQILGRVLRDEPASPRKFDPTVPRDAELIVQTAMAKERERRYQTARDLANDCERLLGGEAITARAPSMLYLVSRRAKRHRVPLIAGLISVLVTTIAVFWFGIRPGMLAAAQDRAVLTAALRDKQAVERAFAALVQAGNYDDAIEQHRVHFGVTPPLPGDLNDPRRAKQPAYEALHTPYDIDLPGAYLARGIAWLAEDDPRARGAIADAFRAGRDDPQHHDSAREAMLILARRLLAANDLESAEYAITLCRRYFGGSHPSTRAALALLRQRQGTLEEAAGLWRGVADEPKFAQEAARNLEVLATLFPVSEWPDPGAGYRLYDLDGDQRPEAVTTNGLGHVLIRRWTGSAWADLPPLTDWPFPDHNPTHVTVCNADTDPELELVRHSWDAAATQGRMAVVEWNGGAPAHAGHGTTPVPFRGFAAADLDGDGWIEWIAATGRDLDVWQYRPGSTIRYRTRWPTFCDTKAIYRRPNGEILIFSGAWVTGTALPVGWRLDSPGAWSIPEEGDPFLDPRGGPSGGPIPLGFRIWVLGHLGKGLFGTVREVPGRFAAGALTERRDGSLLVAARVPGDVAKLLPNLQRGLVHVPFRDGAFQPPVPFGDAQTSATLGIGGFVEMELGGNAVLQSQLSRAQRFIDCADGRERVVGFPAGWRRFQLDADDAAEWYRRAPKGEGAMQVRGVGRWEPPAPITAPAPLPDDGRVRGVLSAAEELIEAHLYEEAVQTCEELLRTGTDPEVEYHRGQALAALGRWNEAAEAYQRATAHGGRAVDALLRRAHMLEQRRDWAGLEACLTAITGARSADPYAKALAAQRLAWITPAAAMQPRVTVTDWSEPALLCEEPFRVARFSDRLRLFATGDESGGAVGAPFHYAGGPLRVRYRIRAGEVQWGAFLTLGIQHTGTLDTPEGWAGSTLIARYRARGATDRPVRFWELDGIARDRLLGRGGAGYDQVVLKPGDAYEFIFDYVPGLDTLTCVILDAEGAPFAELTPARLAGIIETGTYIAGRVSQGDRGPTDFNFGADYELLSVVVEGGPRVKAVTFTPSSIRGWLALANGSLVAGDTGRAALQYSRVFELLDALPAP